MAETTATTREEQEMGKAVKSEWIGGNLVFAQAATGSTILSVDAGGRMTVGNGAEQVPVVHYYAVANDDGNRDIDVTLTYQTEIIDAYVIKLGAAGNAGASSVALQTAAAAPITGAMNIRDAGDGEIVRAATIDLTENTIAAGGTLRIRMAKADNADNNAVRVVVTGRRV